MKNVLKMFIATAIVGVMAVSAFAQGAGPAGGAKGGQKGGPAGGPGGPGKGGPGGGMRRGGMMQWDTEILAKLKLTPGQQAKVKALKEAQQKKGDELRKSFMGGAAKPGAGAKPGAKPGGPAGAPGGQRIKLTDEQRNKLKALREDYTKGLKAILTPAQYSEYEKGMKDMMSKMMQRGPGGPGGGPGKGGPGTPPGKGGAAGKGKGKGTPPPSI